MKVYFNTAWNIEDKIIEISDTMDDYYHMLYNEDSYNPTDTTIIDFFDTEINITNNKHLFKYVCGYRGDVISSDREVVAFVLALEKTGMINTTFIKEREESKIKNAINQSMYFVN